MTMNERAEHRVRPAALLVDRAGTGRSPGRCRGSRRSRPPWRPGQGICEDAVLGLRQVADDHHLDDEVGPERDEAARSSSSDEPRICFEVALSTSSCVRGASSGRGAPGRPVPIGRDRRVRSVDRLSLRAGTSGSRRRPRSAHGHPDDDDGSSVASTSSGTRSIWVEKERRARRTPPIADAGEQGPGQRDLARAGPRRGWPGAGRRAGPQARADDEQDDQVHRQRMISAVRRRPSVTGCAPPSCGPGWVRNGGAGYTLGPPGGLDQSGAVFQGERENIG